MNVSVELQTCIELVLRMGFEYRLLWSLERGRKHPLRSFVRSNDP